MLRKSLAGDFNRIACLAAMICLCACEAKLFESDAREIAGGYRLRRTGEADQFALAIPHQDAALIIDEIGWRQPFIVAKGSGSQYWEVIDTEHAQHTRVNERELKLNPAYRSIETTAPAVAWKSLDPHKRLW